MATNGAYPRMRGGTSSTLITSSIMRGLSPHARGNLAPVLQDSGREGPIPACAGEPDRFILFNHRDRAYPRMRGGT